MWILIAEPDNFSEEAKAIASQVGDVHLSNINHDELKQAFETYDVFWFRLGFRITKELLGLPTRRVSIIVCPVTGLDHIDLDACRTAGVHVVSLKDETEFLRSVRATAELTLGLTISLLRKIPQARADVLAGNWHRDKFRGNEIFGKTVGVVGIGRLGRITADYFVGLGANVIGYDVNDVRVEGVGMMTSLADLVMNADIISIHVSYDHTTHHLIDATLFNRFKQNSVLINTSRGGVVDSVALIDALETGKIAGAALDVIENEHLQESSNLIDYAREHDNLLITPHIGGNTEESFAKTEVFVAQRLLEYAASVAV